MAAPSVAIPLMNAVPAGSKVVIICSVAFQSETEESPSQMVVTDYRRPVPQDGVRAFLSCIPGDARMERQWVDFGKSLAHGLSGTSAPKAACLSAHYGSSSPGTAYLLPPDLHALTTFDHTSCLEVLLTESRPRRTHVPAQLGQSSAAAPSSSGMAASSDAAAGSMYAASAPVGPVTPPLSAHPYYQAGSMMMPAFPPFALPPRDWHSFSSNSNYNTGTGLLPTPSMALLPTPSLPPLLAHSGDVDTSVSERGAGPPSAKRQRTDAGMDTPMDIVGSVPLPLPLLPAPHPRYTYLAFPGNKAEYVTQALARRRCWDDAVGYSRSSSNWKALDRELLSNNWNLVWKRVVKVKLATGDTTLHDLALPVDGRRQLVARVPSPAMLASKTGLLRSMRAWCTQMGLHVYDHLPLSYIIPVAAGARASSSEYAALRFQFNAFASKTHASAASRASADGKQDDDTRTTGCVGSSSCNTVDTLSAGAHTGNGDTEASNSASTHGASTDHVGDTLLLPHTTPTEADNSSGYNHDATRATGMHAKHTLANIWLAKPDFLFAGRGIHITDALPDLNAYLESVAVSGVTDEEGKSVPAGAEWIVQKYVERPLLLRGRKFDIRVNVLVTSALDVYMYEDGFCRTSSSNYSITSSTSGASADAGNPHIAAGSLDDAKHVHITNNCMQIGSASFGLYEEGNILSFEQLQTYLDATYGPGRVLVREHLALRWRELILDSLCASWESVSRRSNGATSTRPFFEMFGYDFLLDEDCRSWLLEVNTNPSLEFHNKWANATFQRMMDDVVSVAVDPLFPPPPKQTWNGLPHELYSEAYVSEVAWLPRAEADALVTQQTMFPPATGNATSARMVIPAVFSHAPPRDPHTVGWTLIFSKNSDLLRIPHQATVSHIAMNGELMAAAAAYEGPVTEDVVRALYDAHGFAATPLGNRWPLLRYIARRDAGFMYPLGPPQPSSSPSASSPLPQAATASVSSGVDTAVATANGS